LKEERINLALQAIKKLQELSVRRAAIVYNVPKATLQRRRAGTQSTRNTYLKLSALTKAEEQALVQCIKKLNAQGLALTLCYVKDIAD
jgi:hypothetical protein